MSQQRWLDATEVARLAGLPSPKHVARMAQHRLIGRRSIPGQRTLYSLQDVERVLGRYTTPPAPDGHEQGAA